LLGLVPLRASANLCPSDVPSLVRMFAPWTHHDFVIAFPVKPSLDHPIRQPSRKITVHLLVGVHTRIPLALAITFADHILFVEPITIVETNHIRLGRWLFGKDLQIIQSDGLLFESRQNVADYLILLGVRTDGHRSLLDVRGSFQEAMHDDAVRGGEFKLRCAL